MLSLLGRGSRLCDGLTRRDALRVGALSVGGLTLTDVLRAERANGGSRKAVIMMYLCGAPPHQDMYDLKPDAPKEYRGDFSPIATSVPGIEICEHLPQLAGMMERWTALRSVYGSPSGAHDSFICYTGRDTRNQPSGGWPSMGAVTSKVLGPRTASVPPFVGLAPDAGHPPYGSPGLPGFLGVGHSAFRPSGPARNDMVLKDVSLDRLGDRKQLLARLDTLRRDVDANGTLDGMDTLEQQAFDILTSSALADALDVAKEPEEVRQRYGKGQESKVGDGAPMNGEHFLMARRLVEAGCRVVTLNFGRWDFHSDNFGNLPKKHLSIFDTALSALVEDLHDRGLADDVAVVAWGEFGRTPRINPQAGRDHWPRVGGGFVAGGGFRHGQTIGATDRIASDIAERPVHFSEVLATLYRHLGIDPGVVKLNDLQGRPQYLLENDSPLPELV